MKSFKQFTEAKKKEIVFTFGRFNPPTVGHEKLIKAVIKIASGRDYKIFASQSNKPDTDPLQYKEKVSIMRKMFPKYARNIILDEKIKTVFNIAVKLYDQGYTDVTMIVGDDRIKEFKTLLNKFNGVKSRHGFYEFDTITLQSAGKRDPDADDVSGMSASKMRAAATAGDFKAFSSGIPRDYGDDMALFNLLRKRMGLKEMTNFRKHVQLPTVSEKRERYISGEIFNVGDRVTCQKTNQNFTITERCSNYIVSGIGTKYFISDVEEYTEESLNPISKHTKKFKDMFGEGVDDPAIFKAVFIAGGPGAGKSFTVGKTGLTALGFKIVNSDDKFEAALKKADLEPTPDNIFSPKGQKLRGRAKELTAKQQDLYIDGRLGLVIDGTGKDYAKIKKQVELMKTIGYDVAMIFVNTDLDTAIARDAKRSRSLGSAVVTKMWKEVQNNLGKFQSMFGSSFIIVDNSDSSNIEKATTDAYKKMAKFAKEAPKNNIAKKWISTQLGESTETALKTKADKTGISYSILKKVFDRGLAAWKTSHRPGTNAVQWGFARVNSFATGGKTQTTADADLWAKHKGKKESVNEGEGKSETWEDGFKRRVVKVTKPEHLESGYKWRIKGKERDNISIKLYKEKPNFEEYKKQMKRVAGHEFGG